jgi:translocation and assembly module TamB
VWKWARRIALVVVALLVAAIAGVVIYVRTEAFRVFLRGQVVAAADAAIRGDVTVGAIEGSIWSRLVLRDVRIAHEGEDVLVVPELRLGYALGPLVVGRLEVTGIEVVEPLVLLRQDADGVWNLAEALAPASAEDAPPPPTEEGAGGLPIDVAITSVDLGGGRIEVALAGEPARRFRLADVHLDASATLGAGAAGRTAVQLRELSARLSGEEIPPVELLAQGALERAGERIRIEVRAVDVRMPESVVHLDARVDDLTRLAIDAELRVERLAVAEMNRLVAGLTGGAASWPLAVDVAASARVSGERSELRAELAASAGGGAIRAEANADLSGEAPVYRATVDLDEIDPAALLGRTDVAGVLRGRAEVSGEGGDLRTARADVALDASGLRVADAALGDLAARVRLAEGEATVSSDLVGSGRAHLEGRLSLEDERYALRLDVDDVDLGRIGGAARAAPSSELTLSARVDGAGLQADTARAAGEITLERSRIGEVVVDRGRVAVQVAEAKARIDAFEVRASGAVLTASGEAGLAGDAPVRLEADLRVPDLAPWLDLVKQEGAGSLTVHVEVGGKPSALATEAQLNAREIRAAGIELAAARVDADLTGVGGDAMAGTARAEVAELAAGIAARRVGLAVELSPGTPPRAQVALDADTADGAQRLRAEVAYGDALAVELRELALVAPTGAWSLDRPARIVRDEKRIAVSGLRLSSRGGGSLSAEGAIAATAATAGGDGLRIRVAALDLSPFQVFAGEAVRGLEGFVEADLRIGGSLEQIAPSGSLRLRDGRAEIVPLGVNVESIGLATRLEPDRIAIEGLSARADGGRIDLDGDVLLRDRRPDAVDLHLAVENWPAIDDDRYQARVAAELDADGPLAGPELRGRLEVLSARLRPPLSLPGSGGPPPRDGSIVVVQEIEETSEEQGAITDVAQQTDVFRDTAIDLEVVIHRGTWIEKDDSSLELAGDLTVEKERGDRDLALIGDVRVVRGWLYLYSRRFEPERGVVTFTGGRKIDPLLDVELQSRVSDYLVKTIVTGTASKPVLEFESEPRLDDADVLALLLFGRPIHDLGEGEKVALEQQAAGIAGNYVAGQLGRALGDSLGFRISELDVTKGLVGVGRYVTPDTYVSIEQSVTGKAARQVQIEHFLTPSWTVKGQTDTSGESGLDVFWKKQY